MTKTNNSQETKPPILIDESRLGARDKTLDNQQDDSGADKKAKEVTVEKSTFPVGLIILMIVGFILRVIAANNIGVTADDMHFAPGAINFIESGKLVYWDQSSALWFCITDLFYQILGPTQIASRAASILFGTLTIPLIFVLAMLFFKNKNVAYIATLLVTFSSQHIKSMMAEMDVMAMFLAFFAIFFLYNSYLKKFDKSSLITSGVLLGLAIYTKVYPLLFIPGMLLFMKKNNCNTKKLLLFCSIIFIFCIPTLTHNYLLLKDKGLMDHQFTRVFGSNEAKAQFSWVAGNNAKFGITTMINGIVEMSRQLARADPLVMLFGILGITVLLHRGFKEKKQTFQLLFYSIIPPFLYLCSVMNLIKHYLFINIVLIFPAALFIEEWTRQRKIEYTKIMRVLLIIIIIIFSMLNLAMVNSNTNFYERSSVSSLMEYKENSIPLESIVIVDSRIYRGQAVWMFSDKFYIESVYANDLLHMPQEYDYTTYFIECKIDDCGWGTIHSQPEFNKSMEEMADFFSKISIPVFENDNFIVYRTTLRLPDDIFETIYKTHVWWMYPLGYDEDIIPIYDKYEVKGWGFDSLLYTFAQAIKFSSIIIIIFVIWLTVETIILTIIGKKLW